MKLLFVRPEPAGSHRWGVHKFLAWGAWVFVVVSMGCLITCSSPQRAEDEVSALKGPDLMGALVRPFSRTRYRSAFVGRDLVFARHASNGGWNPSCASTLHVIDLEPHPEITERLLTQREREQGQVRVSEMSGIRVMLSGSVTVDSGCHISWLFYSQGTLWIHSGVRHELYSDRQADPERRVETQIALELELLSGLLGMDTKRNHDGTRWVPQRRPRPTQR